MHPKEDEEESEVLCIKCPNIFPDKASYKEHRETCSETIENQTTITNQELVLPLKIDDEEAVIHCTKCAKVFPDQASYKKHKKTEHGRKLRKKELKPCSEANCCI